jgi:3'(2'), 5'-bisphosphate nucleotidase
MISAELLDAVRSIAKEAGERILDIYRTDFDVETKSDDSPLTQADLAAHRCIVTGLEKLQPALPILSEEGKSMAFSERGRWERYWLVDPLDGTKEFIKKNDEFTVNIALIENGEPVLGVVHAPALGATYSAARGIGAFRDDGNGAQPISCRKAPERPTFVVSRSHRDDALETMLARLPAHEATSRGSSLKFCLVAEGAADLYPRTGPTCEWDTGAGQCVAEVAGARMRSLPDFGFMTYNRRETLLNPGFVVIGDPDAEWARQLDQ